MDESSENAIEPNRNRREALALRYYNDAVLALDMLFEAAVAGHPGAVRLLHNEAERLVRRGAQWRDAKYGIGEK